jgi:hypothetical protein
VAPTHRSLFGGQEFQGKQRYVEQSSGIGEQEASTETLQRRAPVARLLGFERAGQG